MKDFRDKCIGKRELIGTFAAIPHPVAMEVMAQAGPDFVCIDWEHAPDRPRPIENLVRAADVHGVPAMVRVPGHAPEAIAAALDSGARGVLVPRVSTAAQARGRGEGVALSAAGRARRRARPRRRLRLPHLRLSGRRQRVRSSSRCRSRPPKGSPMSTRSRRPKASTWSSSARATSPCRSTRSGRHGAAEARQGHRDDHRRRAEARQDRRHLLRQAGGCRQMGGQGRQLLHPGQRHDVPRRRRRGRRCAAARNGLKAGRRQAEASG